jgi:hypothetical protein
VCATDAACEGLNLQRLGAQVNVDLPWNPSRLEQRKGRVQKIGQARDNVHILNLRYAGTVEDDVYATLSNRFAGCRLTSSMAAMMRSLSSCLEVTRMWRKTERASLSATYSLGSWPTP